VIEEKYSVTIANKNIVNIVKYY